MKRDFTGVVLAGGKSSRMGQDKGQMLLAGKPLITYTINTLKEVGCQVVISSNNRNYEEYGLPVVPDRVAGIGPLGGIYSSLLASETEKNIVVSCDTPLIPVDLIRFIQDQAKEHQVVVPVFRGYPEPLCGFYRKEVTGIIGEMIHLKKYKMQNLLKRAKTRFLEISPELPFFNERMFTNVNHPDHLHKLSQWLNR